MTIIRAMAVFQGKSGLSEDQFVNTFYFSGDGTYDEDLLLSRSAVESFYCIASPGQTNAIGAYLTPWIPRVNAMIKTYDMTISTAGGVVRTPTNYPFTLPAALGGGGMMEEAAVCLSYHGQVPPTSARRRGRIYLGPLTSNALEFATGTNRARVSPVFSHDLTIAASALVDTPLVQWNLRSTRPAPNYVPIVGGYVDDAFDTQRRRGVDPTARELWAATA